MVRARETPHTPRFRAAVPGDLPGGSFAAGAGRQRCAALSQSEAEVQARAPRESDFLAAEKAEAAARPARHALQGEREGVPRALHSPSVERRPSFEVAAASPQPALSTNSPAAGLFFRP